MASMTPSWFRSFVDFDPNERGKREHVDVVIEGCVTRSRWITPPVQPNVVRRIVGCRGEDGTKVDTRWRDVSGSRLGIPRPIASLLVCFSVRTDVKDINRIKLEQVALRLYGGGLLFIENLASKGYQYTIVT